MHSRAVINSRKAPRVVEFLKKYRAQDILKLGHRKMAHSFTSILKFVGN